MDASRNELHEAVDQLPGDQLPAALADLRSRLRPAPERKAWPPAWFGSVEGSADDVSERVDDILAEGLGRRPA